MLLYLAEHPGTSPRQASVEVLTAAFDEFIAEQLGEDEREAAE